MNEVPNRIIAASPQQIEIWLSMQESQEAFASWHFPFQIKINGAVDPNLLRRAIGILVQRHESLRMSPSEDGQSILIADHVSPDFDYVDLSNESDAEARIHAKLAHEVVTPIDLFAPSRFRVRLFKSSQDQYFLSYCFCHLVCDGASSGVVLEELDEIYFGLVKGVQPRLELAPSYDEYIAALLAQNSDKAKQKALDFWQKNFSTPLPLADLPADFSRPQRRDYHAVHIDQTLSEVQTQKLRQAAKSLGVSQFLICLAAQFICLARWSGEHDLSIGVPSARNFGLGFEGLVGHCIDMVPVRCQLDDDKSLGDFLDELRNGFYDALDNTALTFSEIARVVKAPNLPNRPSLTTINFNMEQTVTASYFGGLPVEDLAPMRAFENAEFVVNMFDHGEFIRCQFSASAALFSTQQLQSAWLDYVGILEQLCTEHPTGKARTLGSIGIANDARQNEILALGNGPQLEGAASKTIFDLLDRSGTFSNCPAIHASDGSLTYAQLFELSGEIANGLAEQGVKTGEVVGVAMGRTKFLVPAILALWQLGAVYLPLDQDYPMERLEHMLADSEASLVLVDESSPQFNVPSLSINDLQVSGSAFQQAQILSHDQAYLIYTSGSTGVPNGVRITHGALANFLTSMAAEPGFGAQDHMLACTTISFDISFLELFLPLIVGGQITLAQSHVVRDGKLFCDALQDNKITHYQGTPSALMLAYASGFQGNDGLTIMVGGEPLPVDLRDKLCADCAAVWNMYGPTETTIWSAVGKMNMPKSADKLYKLTVGRPIANTQILVVDEQSRLCAAGVRGEVFIGGDGLAIGYHQRPEKTAQRFVENPFGNGTLYRTGDIGCLLANGELQILGRSDGQIKLRGNRIELGEIETAIRKIADVDDAAVKLIGQGETACLAGYFTGTQQASFIFQELRRKLPAIMIPSTIESLKELPRTNNGKLDRKALPEPQNARSDGALGLSNEQAVALKADRQFTPHEERLAQIWCEVLGTSNIALEDNFFDLGGYSLLAVQAVLKMEKLTGVRVSPVEFIHRSFEEIAKIYELDGFNQEDAGQEERSEVVQVEAPESSPALDMLVASAEDVVAQVQGTPFYFSSSSGSQLYGVAHGSSAHKKSTVAALICAPMGQEYIRSHRVLRQLCIRLAKEGIPCLRFDYAGTGDSSGEMTDYCEADWLENIADASEKLMQLTGASEVLPIGLRYGAFLLKRIEAETKASIWKKSVLWQPIENGAQHVEELVNLQTAHLIEAYVTGEETKRQVGLEPNEILGIEMPNWFYGSLRAPIAALSPKDLIIKHKAAQSSEPTKQNIFESDEEPFWLTNPQLGSLPMKALYRIVDFAKEMKS